MKYTLIIVGVIGIATVALWWKLETLNKRCLDCIVQQQLTQQVMAAQSDCAQAALEKYKRRWGLREQDAD